jgi:hypothetical protein
MASPSRRQRERDGYEDGMSRVVEALRSLGGERLVAAVNGRARAWLGSRVTAALQPRRDALTEADEILRAARPAAGRLGARIDRDLLRFDLSPFSPRMTVHAAHARHPGVREAFARRGLPRCEDCAVGADETLAEAAFGEGFDVEALVAELEALATGA